MPPDVASTITTPPKPGHTYWTAYTQLEGDSMPTDPLRFEMYAERLGNVLLPGITNRVERLRYFGMVCAGLQVTRPQGGAVDDRAHTRLWKRSFLPFEAGWALVNVAADGEIKDRPPAVERPRLKDEFRGFRGANRVLSYYRDVKDSAQIKPNGYRLLKAQEAQGGLGAYLVALRRYGLVQHDRFELTALGNDLGRAFLGSSSRSAWRLASPSSEARRTLRTLGERLLLTRPSRAEAQIVTAAVFGGDGPAAGMFRRLPLRLRAGGSAEEALQHVARADGDPLERAAHYALMFEPFRKAALATFAELGKQLTGTGSARVVDLDHSDLDELIEETYRRAQVLAGLPTVSGLEPIATLAQRIAAAPGGNETLHALVSFHRQEGRRWIEIGGGNRYMLGANGAFVPPDNSFHGYTLPSAMSIYRDTRQALA
jgi:hypothetical protein